MRLNLSLLEGTAPTRAWRSGRELHRDGKVRRIARRDLEEDGSEGYDAVVRAQRGQPDMKVGLAIDFSEVHTAVLEEWGCSCELGDTCCEHTVAAALAVRDALARQTRVGDAPESSAVWREVLDVDGLVADTSVRASWICYDLSLLTREAGATVSVVRRRRSLTDKGRNASGAAMGWTPTAVGHFGYRTGDDPAKNRDDLVPVLCVVNRHDLRVRTIQPGFIDSFLRLFVDAEPFVLRVDGDDAHVESAERPVAVVVEDAPDGGLEVSARIQSHVPGRLDDDHVLLPGPVSWVYLRQEKTFVRPGARSQAALHLLRAGAVHVPSDEVDGFCHDVLPILRGEAELVEQSDRLPPVRTAAAAVRIVLDELDDGLTVALRFAYGVGGAEPHVFESGTGTRVFAQDVHGEPMLWQRDEELEGRWTEDVSTRLGAALPASLGTDDALDFLLDHLPELEQAGAKIFGREALVKLRPSQQRVSASVRLSSGIDWFGIKVSVKAGAAELELDDVIAAWRSGARHVRLQDGELARLPVQWLNKHIGVLTDARELGHEREDGTLEISPFLVPALAELIGDQLHQDERWRSLVGALAGFDGVREHELPEGLDAELRSYQKHGYDWLCTLRDLGFGACLADDMGLGKTVQAIALLTAEVESKRAQAPTLVVAPTSVVQNWQSELKRFAPGLRVAVLHADARAERLKLLARLQEFDVVLTSYALLRLDSEALQQYRFHYLVLDEAQAIKNPNSQTARAARDMPAAHRLTLTGTPLENNLLELWSQFEFLMPGFFGSRARFVRRYGASRRGPTASQAMEELRARLRPFLLRRLKKDVDQELPPVTEMTLRCQLGPAQRKLYNRIRDTYRSKVMGTQGKGEPNSLTLGVLEALLRLRQAACHPSLLPFDDARQVRESAKTKMFINTLTQLLEEGRRVLVFSQWTSMLRILRDEMDDQGIGYAYMDGSTRDRAGVINHFQDPDGPPVFLISLKAGGVGLNLTAADTVILHDPWWNPAAEQQASDRAHRIGQTRPVLVLRMVVEDTVEDLIMRLQARKRELVRSAIEVDGSGFKDLSRTDLESIFGNSPAPSEDASE
ncbi:MAG: SNF2 helicase associated domain-containing protein [Myxococcales bacterium]|nr:SNF2 helicase associated domain-containing protein [Myxococcales bacterium]